MSQTHKIDPFSSFSVARSRCSVWSGYISNGGLTFLNLSLIQSTLTLAQRVWAIASAWTMWSPVSMYIKTACLMNVHFNWVILGSILIFQGVIITSMHHEVQYITGWIKYDTGFLGISEPPEGTCRILKLINPRPWILTRHELIFSPSFPRPGNPN